MTHQTRSSIATLALALALTASQGALASTTHPTPAKARASAAHKRSGVGAPWTGLISYYGPGFQGKRTASGERFNAQALTMAHRTLPFGTRVRVTALGTGRSVVLRVNDRGPWARGRIADVSLAAARVLGMHG
ncbi:MAG: hypothetical protein RJA98_2935, partial [Pseudomonadota bacterium]